jgi:penicillin-binding protein 1B
VTRRRKKARRKPPRRQFPWLKRLLWRVAVAGVLVFVAWAAWLDWRITRQFEGSRWDLPAQVFAEPVEIYAGYPLSVEGFVELLSDHGYRPADGRNVEPGTWWRQGSSVRLVTRPFRFPDGIEPARAAQVDFSGRAVARIRDPAGPEMTLLRLDPMHIGSIFPFHGQDRIVLPPDEVPALLEEALIAVEDRRFRTHIGVDPEAIGRALVANIRAGGIRQGGSTLTQQLVKSYFLDSRQTLGRKATEAVMAVLLELHYEKDDILNTYVNEVYLGQDGPRAVHGFGLGSLWYFGKPLGELDATELATLVAIVRGPSYYNPWRQPERVRDRRDLVLRILGEQGVMSADAARAAAERPLTLRRSARSGPGYHPAFLELVRRQLKRDYRQSDLETAGLTVLTTLDPRAQAAAQAAVENQLAVIEERGAPATDLQAAIVVTRPATGEIQALVGGRDAGFAGFNRALDARRPIGSLVKPAVYLAALETGRYTLATSVDDLPVQVPLDDGTVWMPSNFDNTPHGPVSAVRALAESYNLAAVRVGMDVGPARVMDRLGELAGIQTPPGYPASLLGSVELTPMEVAAFYGSLASGGFRAPLRAVRAVLDNSGEPLSRYPLEVAQVADPAAVTQLNRALVAVMERGTGRSARAVLGQRRLAGKSGTSGDYRDSWFAGFGGDNLAVAWVGRDDNAAVGLTGSSGALKLWAEVMASLGTRDLRAGDVAGLVEVDVEYATGLLASDACADTVRVPVPEDARLAVKPGCGPEADNLAERGLKWLKDILGGD